MIMNKNIKTHEADINLVEKFLDYANCADASYAMLHYINDTIKQDKKSGEKEEGDKQTQGHKFNNQNSTYARAIQARFQQDKIIDKSLCVPYTNTCLNNETINNDITKVKLDDTLSQRTINFVNRFKILHHQPNTDWILRYAISSQIHKRIYLIYSWHIMKM